MAIDLIITLKIKATVRWFLLQPCLVFVQYKSAEIVLRHKTSVMLEAPVHDVIYKKHHRLQLVDGIVKPIQGVYFILCSSKFKFGKVLGRGTDTQHTEVFGLRTCLFCNKDICTSFGVLLIACDTRQSSP